MLYIAVRCIRAPELTLMLRSNFVILQQAVAFEHRMSSDCRHTWLPLWSNKFFILFDLLENNW